MVPAVKAVVAMHLPLATVTVSVPCPRPSPRAKGMGRPRPLPLSVGTVAAVKAVIAMHQHLATVTVSVPCPRPRPRAMGWGTAKAPALDSGDGVGDAQASGEGGSAGEVTAAMALVALAGSGGIGGNDAAAPGSSLNTSPMYDNEVQCDSCCRFTDFKKCRVISKTKGSWRCNQCGVKCTQLRRMFTTWPTDEFSLLTKERVACSPNHHSGQTHYICLC